MQANVTISSARNTVDDTYSTTFQIVDRSGPARDGPGRAASPLCPGLDGQQVPHRDHPDQLAVAVSHRKVANPQDEHALDDCPGVLVDTGRLRARRRIG